MLLVETGVILFLNIIHKSAPSEIFLLSFSLERLLLIIALSIAFIICIVCLIQSIRTIKQKDTWISRLLKNQKALWVIIYLSLFLCAFLYYLLIQDVAWFGTAYPIYLKLEPTMIWLLSVSSQVLFFSIFWYCVNFTGIFSKEETTFSSKDIHLLGIIFLLFLSLKVFIINPHGYGFLRDYGESMYFRVIEDLRNRIFLTSAYETTTRSPFLYALSLSPALAMKNYAFDIIKALNQIYTVSIVFPIYLLSRQLLGKKESMAVVLISCVIPFQFLVPIRLLSENLYFPLLFWTAYFVYARPGDEKYRLVWDGLTGIFIGILYLTRYITLALIPAFLLCWWLKPFSGCKGNLDISFKKVMHLSVILLCVGLVFSPWILINLNNRFSFPYALGLSIAEETTIEQLTAGNLGKWLCFYLGYLILILAPFLNLLFYLRNSWAEDVELRHWFVKVLLITCAFLAAVVRHSWRAWYNGDIPLRIMGRYLIYLLPIYLITAFAVLKKRIAEPRLSLNKAILTGFVLPVGLVAFSYLLLISGKVFPIQPGFIDSTISIDGYYVKSMGVFFFIYLCIIYILGNFLILQKHRFSLEILTVLLMVYYLVGLPDYLGEYDDLQRYPKLGASIAHMIIDCENSEDEARSYVIYLPEELESDYANDIAWSIRIRNLDREITLAYYDADDLDEILEGEGIVVYPSTMTDIQIDDERFIDAGDGEYTIRMLNAEDRCKHSRE